jgi:predicted RNase H-like HicB family nuclease
MTFDDYKLVLYCQDGGWVAEIPSISGCYVLMPSREEALAELRRVFDLIAEEYREQGKDLPADTTEIVNAWRHGAGLPASSHATRFHSESGRRAVTIPIHGGRGIGPPLFFKILRQLNVTLHEFEALR